MSRLNSFTKTSLLGGLAVILPVAIFLFIFKWLLNWTTSIIQPLTNLVMAKSHLQEIAADLLVLAVIILTCFFVGMIVKTKVGRFIHENLENHILKAFPGYSLIKDTVMQFVDQDKSPFSSVALVNIFENNTLMTGFVTDSHADGSYTVFVPTGPNPTSGNIYHLKHEFVRVIDAPVEEAMRSIISCGAGSTGLLRAYPKN
ncbi:MAG: DUF502 domain-containing protein [Deltaproteobacteria bacterium]|nr:DUF502 domain-containing protein [Deltaproteobacteria bacterium]MBW2324841.1 DUF502 domain-containing protein [Deltaproteobacteria bacterium]